MHAVDSQTAERVWKWGTASQRKRERQFIIHNHKYIIAIQSLDNMGGSPRMGGVQSVIEQTCEKMKTQVRVDIWL